MENIIIIILGLILVETSVILWRVFGKKPREIGGRRKVFVDTSVLMDGRILAVALSGFIGDELLIPKGVVREMQLLADGKDSEKRARARFGMDITSQLLKIDDLQVSIFDDAEVLKEGVDERLLTLAKEHGALILTNDFNLGKVAATENITVLNVNDLAQGLKSEFQAGDQLEVEIAQKGSGRGQGVGYLPDGTMVVVDRASRDVGKKVKIQISRHHQTGAGRMAFARKV
ncbi:MAG: TRAM domain-containing protein [Candidatus Nomurabacteria bacterium]|jgi:uncharacterized protein YacL|nr:TRAM domain-containing protein [Candidatus Nomurabacteria bacterium]